MDLDLRRLRCFVAVAERLSFVKAADELHLTQPALSRQIQALESELGVTLLLRDRRGTSLTPPGRELLAEARPLLEAALALERRVRAAAKGTLEFFVGFMPGVPSTGIVREFADHAPEVAVEVVYVPMDEQESLLEDGRVDVSFVRLPLHSVELDAIPLFPEPRVAVLPADSPLADAESVTLDELAAYALIGRPETLPQWRGPVLVRRRPPVTIDDRIEASAAGHGFTVLPAGIAAYHRRDDVASVPLADVPPVTVGLGYLRNRAMPEIQTFAAIAARHLT